MTQDATRGPERLREMVGQQLREAADDIVPWFAGNMPDYYFRTHDEEEQARHVRALISGMVRQERQSMIMHSPCGTMVTHISPGGDMTSLAGVLRQYLDRDIRIARIYSSRDDSIRLDTLIFGPRARCTADSPALAQALETARRGGFDLAPGEAGDFEAFLARSSEDYLEKFEPGRAVRHFRTCGCVAGVERVLVTFDREPVPGFDRVSVAMENPPSRGLLLRVVNVFAWEDIPVDRAYADVFEGEGGTATAVMSFYLDRSRILLDEGSEAWERLRRQLELTKWFAFHGLEALADEDGWELAEVMLMQAAAEFAHQFLISKNLHAYGSGRIVYAVLKHRGVARLLLDYFAARCDPALPGDRAAAISARRQAVMDAIGGVDNEIHRDILKYIYRFFRYTLRTNYYLPHRLGLSFRLDPVVLAPVSAAERPFGIYCFHGPYCFGFHVRYRDMARGGVRVVRTGSQEHFELESNRLLDEVTKLARAQQLKNKDIPEGGAKAVLLLGPDADIDLAVRSMIDSFLDLLVLPAEGGLTPPFVVDHLGHDEVIFLGPDENITPAHIVWIAARAARRGYRWPGAFMSSKPGAGIAHKEYGVTSEGVVVFARELLLALCIDPLVQPFTVKMTGGPAGDVASNVVRILFREYGENARIVAMTDGHGAAYDPAGLDHAELLRLMDTGRRTADFDTALLRGEGAFVVPVGDPDGVRIRNDLHNVPRTDLFIPAGGRPETINMGNWKRFLTKDGTPSARGIVEGANIFIAADARAELEKAGVLVVPGPSANKTGVICSSYEILAGLVLSDEEFLAIKKTYVAELLDILRARAGDEARLLMREYRLAGGEKTVTQLSYALSAAINGLADRIAAVLEGERGGVANDPELRAALLAYCPPVLAGRYADRLVNDLPSRHRTALLAASLSARMFYQEGLGWAERLTSVRGVREVAYAYLACETELAGLAAEVRAAGLARGQEVADILEGEGRKRLVLRRLGLE
ncbi:NAD-glutamate dehydrogenase domain-containing protein [Pseudodesulfovibrio pelocollis]|uniref:NAD-glutamate dehydrogenase domain-containing protein n=1 Tax=Pseudodesulfovibrio pelocollis TaxID=3051432 RepID=UPI00255A7603|nr:NAD-glutamate dehydrogenase domain-containing protein [Pseudodesulfovibrio sp. SB368]